MRIDPEDINEMGEFGKTKSVTAERIASDQCNKAMLEYVKKDNGDVIIHIFPKIRRMTDQDIFRIGTSIESSFRDKGPQGIDKKVNFFTGINAFCVVLERFAKRPTFSHFMSTKAKELVDTAIRLA